MFETNPHLLSSFDHRGGEGQYAGCESVPKSARACSLVGPDGPFAAWEGPFQDPEITRCLRYIKFSLIVAVFLQHIHQFLDRSCRPL